MTPSLSFVTFVCLTFVWLKDEVTIDDHADRETWSDRQRRLDVEIALNNLLSGLIQALAGATAKRLDDTAALQV